MKNAVYAQLISISFIFLSRFYFTVFPNIIKGNISYAIITSLLFLAANAIPVWFFLVLRNEVSKELKLKPVFDLLLICLVLNLIHRFLIVLLTLELSNLFIERLLYQIRFIIPVILYSCLLWFFVNFRKKSVGSKYTKLSKIFKMNEIGFGLLTLMTAAGLLDHLTGGNLYKTLSAGQYHVEIISFLIIIFVYYVSLRFYLGILKISEGSA